MLGTYTVGFRDEQRLVVVGGERSGNVFLNQSTSTAVPMTAANLQCFRHIFRQNARRMICLSTECSGFIQRNVHANATLIHQTI